MKRCCAGVVILLALGLLGGCTHSTRAELGSDRYETVYHPAPTMLSVQSPQAGPSDNEAP